MRGRTLSHHQRGDVHLFARQCCLLGTRQCRWIVAREKRRSDLEEPDIALHARQVVLGARYQRRDEITAQKGLVLSQWVGDAHGAPFILGDEGHRPNFVQSGADERFLNVARHRDQRGVGHCAGAERTHLR